MTSAYTGRAGEPRQREMAYFVPNLELSALLEIGLEAFAAVRRAIELEEDA